MDLWLYGLTYPSLVIGLLQHHVIKYIHTVNWEVFMYENIHVLNVHINKLLWVSHENNLARKFCQVEITVHVRIAT